jgi:pimeloyl-ACP methyl ester carboxylesterase
LFRAFLPSSIAAGRPLLAPTFDNERYPGYQRLEGGSTGMAAMALISLLADASSALGLVTQEVDLFGFSGGAQFVHRFAILYPNQVRAVVAASAGWYTYLDPSRAFPVGLGGAAADPRGFLSRPALVMVGERDTGRDRQLRTGRRIDREQGQHRLERALRWVDHLENCAQAHGLASRVSFDVLADSGHSVSEAVHRGGLVTRTMEFLDEVSMQTIPVDPVRP